MTSVHAAGDSANSASVHCVEIQVSKQVHLMIENSQSANSMQIIVPSFTGTLAVLRSRPFQMLPQKAAMQSRQNFDCPLTVHMNCGSYFSMLLRSHSFDQ
ncbi:uncharacterized protein PHALS_03117 [Plasmopara halstedii]|uniref:Uncharacterized protein n=1 Tax=Plasmopara halstedii TaxID=4781 RepID=A0A0P1A8D5_PLAHL|nr:uncharacterized protein PHALS_03117 [Plasmopara halstedii]CEG36569.1 hypothetical protein PHALS_03117 [Plasmopara halstedii]|eukprot:XP_024572938.1 hypothetical protein PHALS_03117 [Plasmopara halstedii]